MDKVSKRERKGPAQMKPKKVGFFPRVTKKTRQQEKIEEKRSSFTGRLLERLKP